MSDSLCGVERCHECIPESRETYYSEDRNREIKNLRLWKQPELESAKNYTVVNRKSATSYKTHCV
jgi:hypothetical protein